MANLKQSSVVVQPDLCPNCLETPNTGFPMTAHFTFTLYSAAHMVCAFGLAALLMSGPKYEGCPETGLDKAIVIVYPCPK